MSDDDMKNDWLIRRIKDLPLTIEPERELWPDLAKRIAQDIQHQLSSNNSKRSRWMPFALAASVLIAVISLSFSWYTLERQDRVIQEHLFTQQQWIKLQFYELKRHDQKVAFRQVLEHLQPAMDSATYADVSNNVVVLEQAIIELKAALEKSPDNRSLQTLLIHTYQQEQALMLQVNAGVSKLI